MKLVMILVGTAILILQMGEAVAMPSSLPDQSFRQIEQPTALKISVVVGGIILIGAESWWFLRRK